MSDSDIPRIFRDRTLETSVGNFEFVKTLGEGANSYVLEFRKGSAFFAVKFLKSADSHKLSRFRDEFFCAAQIPKHQNVSTAYHFEKITVESVPYHIIIMKRYSRTLHDEGNIAHESCAVKADKALRLMKCLLQAIRHLHDNDVIHRDLKPQNVFFDEETSTYVVGDLGIAQFLGFQDQKESKTSKAERLANFGFSAPEQVFGGAAVADPPADIFAVAQIVHWYITGNIYRGTGNLRLSEKSDQMLDVIERTLDRCLRQEPRQRPQTVSEVFQLMEPPMPGTFVPDFWANLHAFDHERPVV